MGVVDNVMAADVCVMDAVWTFLLWLHHNGRDMLIEYWLVMKNKSSE